MPENSKNRIAINVITSALQVVIVGLVYFFVYRILVLKLGVDLLGVWSLIIATSSISNLANFGFTSALVKFVAEYNAKGDLSEINKLLFTSMLSMLVFFLCITIVVYFLGFLFIDRLVDLKYIEVALKVLPLSLLCLIINSLGGVLTSALEGFQRNYIRNIIYSFTSICYLSLTIILIPHYGLVGLAISQVVQSILILFFSYFTLKKRLDYLNLFRWGWDYSIFRKLFNYGYKVQVISVSQMLIDPVTKVLISRYNGLTTLGFYEMASRLISQLRQIIVNMNQVTIPIVSHYFQVDKSAIKYVYKRGISLIVFIVFPLVAGIIIFTPYLSKFWIGSVEHVFVNAAYLIALAMLFNILCTPAYFNSFGEGDLNGVLTMNILVASLNLLLGILFGRIIPVYGVIITWGISGALGSFYLIYYYHMRNKIKFRELLRPSDYIMIIIAVLFSILALLVFRDIGINSNYSIKSLTFSIIIYSLFFIPAAYFNRNFRLLNIFQYLKS
jgi:O-antigen/teichoic acid export membrane protein